MTELSRRAVACKGWRWLPGMLAIIPRRTRGVRLSSGDELDEALSPMPDLTDPATLGCLLSLVRDAWDEPLAWVYYEHGATEAAALVAALEAAP